MATDLSKHIFDRAADMLMDVSYAIRCKPSAMPGISYLEEMAANLRDAAAAVRAEAGTGGMEILRLVAAIPLWRDAYPHDERDIFEATGLPAFDNLTPEHVRQARTIVAAGKEVMPPELHCSTPGPLDSPPPTAGPIPPAGALAGWKLIPIQPTEEMIEAGDHVCRRYCNLGSQVGGIFQEMLAAAPAPQPPAPAEGAPDVAQLIKDLYARWDEDNEDGHGGRSYQCKLAADTLAAQAAALATKEAEITELERRVKAHGATILRRDQVEGRLHEMGVQANARIAKLEAALRPFAEYHEMLERNRRINGHDLISRQNGEVLGHAAIQAEDLRIARVALAQKEPQQP